MIQKMSSQFYAAAWIIAKGVYAINTPWRWLNHRCWSLSLWLTAKVIEVTFRESFQFCTTCGGGWIKELPCICHTTLPGELETEECWRCTGTGRDPILDGACAECYGKGTISI